MSTVSDHNNLSLEKYFSQGLSGVTKRTERENDDFKAFKQDAFLVNPNVERSTRKNIDALLKNQVMDSYILDSLQQELVQNDSVSTAEYGQIVRNLAQALKEAATAYSTDSQEFKILIAASKLAHQLEQGRQQYKEGRDALLPA